MSLAEQIPSPAAIRAELEQLVIRDLLGPAGGPEEDVTESVRDRYLVGMLAPLRQQVTPELQDDLPPADESPEDGPIDRSTAQAPTLFPSSFGMSFGVADAATAIRITARWGRYMRQKSDYLASERTGEPRTVWKRLPMGGEPRIIPLADGPIDAYAPDPDHDRVVVKGRIRRTAGGWVVTLFLVNTEVEPEKLRDAAWIFQPELHVDAPDGSAIFRRRALQAPPSDDPVTQAEEDALAMRYRHEVEFAIGHGVSVRAEVAPFDPTCAYRLQTDVVPTYEVPQTVAPTPAEEPELAGLVVDMAALADTADGQFGAALNPLAAAYDAWLARQEARINDPGSRLAAFADRVQDTIRDGRAALERIRVGIALLDSNMQAATAFRFMNRAMWQQRIHAIFAEERRRGGAPELAQIDEPKNRSWRPFQVAFILLNLPALTDLRHPDRSTSHEALADLLFFPTGGGKTEAYLGLTAYTLGIRRLQGTVAGRSGHEGVAVLMRYTLRLLTLQQFQRAAALICACELIRRENPAQWGQTPFRIGLWVGQRTTPNTADQSDEAVKREHGQAGRPSAFGGSGSPAQVTNCPWCGTPIDPARNHIQVDKILRRTFIWCGDSFGACPFSRKQSPGEGLPVLVVDEDIYRRLPALLIATVDKFAQLPWNGATGMLFGQVDGLCPRHGFRSPDYADKQFHPARGKDYPAVTVQPHPQLRPPDLIIQDELHLISGPLGTLVGLYETAVDHLASWDIGGARVRPKVIASTATVRRAPDQVHALFARRVAVFPPPGLDAADSFFARQVPDTAQTPGRRYLGICAIGKRQKAVLIRVYVAFMAAAQTLYERYGVHADPYMTLVGYFNAMRELGGMRRLVEDDVRSRLAKTDQRGLARRGAPLLEELTSRKGATDIPRILDLLEVRFDPADEERLAQARKQRRQVTLRKPLDVLLATNMISVGVDVKRLGLMVVSGQPKTTAEYIQATSRVGRSFPGLVCTIFNWARPRDLSHYEQFAHYHATFYQHVEALSVTPFAAQAIRRGLAGVLVALVRLMGDEFNANDRAGRVTAGHSYVQEAVRLLSQRAALVTGRRDVADQVEAELRALLDIWHEQAGRTTSGRTLNYRKRRDEVGVALLKNPDRGQWDAFTTLTSLRDVEPGVGLILDERDLGDDQGRSLMPFVGAPDAKADNEEHAV
jgi:hypothetical protein